MKRIAFTVVLVLAAAPLLAPAAMADRLHANVLSWTPNHVKPGEPVSIVLQLYTVAGSPNPQGGKPVAGVKGVEVVIRGGGPTRRFAAEDLGGGRYRTEIVFPNNGGWDVYVRYDPRGDGPGEETELGKGGICVGASVCGAGPLERGENATATRDESGWVGPLAAVVGAIGVAGVAGVVLRGLGRPRRVVRKGRGARAPTAPTAR
jgi:hypothetical protein